jgi:MFS family permease
MQNEKRNQLFLASCLALLTTSLSFSIRAGILDGLGKDFGLSNTQLGYITSMAFFGFPIATMVGGFLYNELGPKRLMMAAFLTHIVGILLTVFASGFVTLLISTFCIGFANGMVEAACNPMVASLYPEKKTTMLNKFHVWFPGGIVIGSLLSAAFTEVGLNWQVQVAMMLIPAAIYGWLFYKADYSLVPKTLGGTTTSQLATIFTTPLFLFLAFIMTITATTELGTQGWIEKLLKSSGIHPLVVLAMITGLMAVGRYFAGPVIHRLNPTGVLLGSSVLALAGIGLFSIADSIPVTVIASILFAAGVCYFWPTMIGFVAEYLPKTGALGMSLLGGVGMFGLALWQPIIGGWLDTAKADALGQGMSVDMAELAAGKATLDNLAFFPAALIVLFAILYFYMRTKVKTHGSASL